MLCVFVRRFQEDYRCNKTPRITSIRHQSLVKRLSGGWRESNTVGHLPGNLEQFFALGLGHQGEQQLQHPPSDGAAIVCSIFIASITASGWPW
jgi:hypothetical protein